MTKKTSNIITYIVFIILALIAIGCLFIPTPMASFTAIKWAGCPLIIAMCIVNIYLTAKNK